MEMTPGLVPPHNRARSTTGSDATLRGSLSGDHSHTPLCLNAKLNASLRDAKLDRRLPDSLQLAREHFTRPVTDADGDEDLVSASTWCSEGGAARGSFSTRKVRTTSPPVGLVAQRAASTSGLSDVEMGEQLDDIMTDARFGDCEADATAAPMAEEAAADSASVADAAPIEEGEEPSNWANLPDGVLQEVMKHMSSSYLRRVRLVCNGWAAFAGRFCTDLKPEYLPDGGRRLAKRFPYLRLLDLSHCSEIVIHAKAHNELRLQSSLTDESLAHLAPLQRLEELSLKSCAGLQGPGLRHLVGLPNLHRLDLQACIRLTNKGLEHVAQMSRLTHLNLRDCRLLTNDGLRRLAPLKGLKSLALSNASGVTDKGLQCLAELTGLEHFAISRCPYVTDRGFSALLLQPLPCLKRIVVRRCPGVTESGLRAIAELKQVDATANAEAGIAA